MRALGAWPGRWLGQLATFHAPDDLVVAACVAARPAARLGVAQVATARAAPDADDALGPRRLVVSATLSELDELLADMVAKRPRFQRGRERVAAATRSSRHTS